MESLLQQISRCTLCSDKLFHGVRPVITASTESRLIIIGQAPGRKVHETGIPWNDRSGETLRSWLQLEPADFYNPEKITLMPMGFCYPGKGPSGDLPPMKTCAPKWHRKVLSRIDKPELMLLIGNHAQQYYLGKRAYGTLTETVAHAEEFLPQYFPLPHPSPRNTYWQKKNPWFEERIIPLLREATAKVLRAA